MKRILTVLILIAASNAAMSQITQFNPGMPHFVNSMGGSGIIGATHYNYTVGEPYVQFGGQACDSLFAGFQHLTNFDTISNTISVVANGPTTFCLNDSVQLSASISGSSYTWYRNNLVVGTNATFNATQSGNYKVRVVNACGDVVYSNTITVTTTNPPGGELCMVTVDTVNYDHNVIFWDPNAFANADSFKVYRESTTNNYVLIATIAATEPGEFHDLLANPNVQSFRYKLAVKDNCGNIGAQSLYHNTIKLDVSLTGVLTWVQYSIESTTTPVTEYKVYRDNLNNNVWTQLNTLPIAGTQNSYTDADYATYVGANYRVDAEGFSCDPTRAINTTRSNIKNIVPNVVLSVTANNTNTCAGQCTGTAQASAAGGTGNYTYTWMPGNLSGASISNLCPGTYTVTVNDGNATSTASVTVVGNALPNAAVNPTSGVITCTNPIVSITASGGGSYQWNAIAGNATTPDVFASTAGTYTVTVTNSNGCTANASATITSNTTAPVAAITPNTGVLTCTTTSINITASGNGTYLWDNGSTNSVRSVSAAGTYTVTVTSANGCTDQASVTITSNTTPPVATINPSTGEITCSTQNITLVANGGVTYLWSGGGPSTPNYTITSGGTYSVTVTGANGCTDQESVTITSNNLPPNASITATPNPVCANFPVTLSVANAGIGAIYTWGGGVGNGGIVNNSNDTTTATPNTQGAVNYTVFIVGSNGCTNNGNINVLVSSSATWYQDLDNDTYGNPNVSLSQCTQPVGYVGNNTDCDDNNNSVNALPTAAVISPPGPITFCDGGSVTLNGNNNGGTWSNNATTTSINVTTSGTYFVTNSNSCGSVTSDSIVVTVNALPDTSVTAGVNLVANQTGATYQWIDCNNNYIAIAGETNPSFAPPIGSFAVIITLNGCSDTSDCYVVTDLHSTQANADFYIYPNPANESITIKNEGFVLNQNTTVSIYDMLGAIVHNEQMTSNLMMVNIQTYAKGVYTIEIEASESRLYKKLIVE